MGVISETIYGNVKVVRNDNYKWGVVDKEGNVIVPFGKYEWIEGFEQGLSRVKTRVKIKESAEKNSIPPKTLLEKILKFQGYPKWGIINKKGEEVLPLVYDEIWKFFGKGRCSTRVVKDGVATQVYFHDLNPELPVRGIRSTKYRNDNCFDDDCQIDWDEEKWWALTDGMFGDYPGPGFDYDLLGF